MRTLSVVAITVLLFGVLTGCGGEIEEPSFENSAIVEESGSLGGWLSANTWIVLAKSWSVKKSVDQPSLTLGAGQSHLVNYTVEVQYSGATVNEHKIEGYVFVENTADTAATVTGVTLTMDGTTTIPVSCQTSFPKTLYTGSSFICSYSITVADSSNRSLVAKIATSGSGVELTKTADFSGAYYAYTDYCVTVTDSLVGPLGQVCYGQSPATIKYSMYIGPYDVCGKYKVVNTAKLVGSETGTTVTDSATVNVDVPSCSGGCTLTPGYWKTHSNFGPAPYDSTWAALPLGASSPFFRSGQSYYDVLWTPPKGNAYYILAHAFIAAELNGINGASRPADVSTAYTAAEALLLNLAPSDVTRSNRKSFIDLGATLDDYNNGLTGPGHCTE